MDYGSQRQYLALLTAGALVLAACGTGGNAAVPGNAIATATTVADIGSAPTAVTAAPSTVATTTTSTTQPLIVPTSTTAPTTTTTTATTTEPAPTTTVEGLPEPALAGANAAFDALAASNAAVSLTVMRDGVTVLGRASGTTLDGAPATSDSPMVIASVSKLVIAIAIAHLGQVGSVDVEGPVPWDVIGLEVHPDWADVTIRELLDHTSGMPVVRQSWFTGVGDCAAYIPLLVAASPMSHRGAWTYSNGNYCALGRLIEQLTGESLAGAAQQLVFDPLDRAGIHLTTDGLLPGDVGHGYDVARLSRLGGAGTFVVSTDDLAAMLSTITPEDLTTLAFPGIMTDQYGWGHTGTIDGAKACIWVLESGRTVVAATVAGDVPSTGGRVCDRVVPAVVVDLGLGNGERPSRTP